MLHFYLFKNGVTILFKSIVPAILFLQLSSPALAQLNMKDSTALIVPYWKAGEKKIYNCSMENYTVRNGDTLSKETASYQVTVTVETSLTELEDNFLEWAYSNVQCTGTDELSKKLMALQANMKLKLRISLTGELMELKNWTEVKTKAGLILSELKKTYSSNPDAIARIENYQANYASEELIVNNILQDVKHYLLFYSASYKWKNRQIATVATPSPFGKSPINASRTVAMDEINQANQVVEIKLTQIVDSRELTNQAYQFYKENAQKEGTPVPARTDLSEMKNENRITQKINAETGWLLKTKTIVSQVYADGTKAFSISSMELK